jgi:capsular exopolysaccharide synthesis family protein
MHDVKQDSEALDLKQAIGVLRRRLPVIVLCVVVVAGAAFAFSRHEGKKYTATSSLFFSSSGLTNEIVGLPANSSGVSLLAQQASDLELVKLGDMAAKTARLLGHGLTEQGVSESVSVAGQGESGVVNVSATASSPVLAAAIANNYTKLFVKEQKNTNSQYYKSALTLVHKQLAALSPQQRVGADGLQLQNRAQTLGLLSELKQGNVDVAQEAVAPTSPSSPKTSRNTIVGGVLGLFIGLALAFILEPLDRRIRTSEDLETIYRLPLLGAVPESKALSGKLAALPLAEAEAFSLIRAHLRFFNSDRDLRTVAVVSAAVGDGKTATAVYLAEAAARSGSRVLLLELDLRRPTLAQQLDIDAGPGAAGVLMGAIRMDEATRSVDLSTSSPADGAMGRTFDVLPAGALLPPNPGELIESQAMETVLEQARSAYDLVVLDTPPLISVSDAFPLLTKVDGVIIVGRVEHSRRDAAERLHRILANSGARLLGVIANGAKSGGPGVYRRGGQSSPVEVSDNGASSSDAFITAGKA